MNIAIYTCLIGDSKENIKILHLFLKSLRNNGKFTGDIYLLTDNSPENFDELSIFDFRVIKILPNDYHIRDKTIETSQCSYYPYGGFFKSFVINHVDILKYDIIVHSDLDIVFSKNVNVLFEGMKENKLYITKGSFGFNSEYYLNDRMVEVLNIQKTEKNLGKLIHNIPLNTGFFFSSPTYITKFFNLFKDVYYNVDSCNFINIGQRKWSGLMDQNVVNYIYFSESIDIEIIDNRYYTYLYNNKNKDLVMLHATGPRNKILRMKKFIGEK